MEKWNLVYQIITILARIGILIFTEDYVLYLAVELVIYAIQNLLNGWIVNKRYPYIKTKVKYSLEKKIKENIKMNVKAMFLQNIGGYLVFGTDNILISSFISVTIVGLYSNYTMITQQLVSLIKPILGGIGASVGNLIATEDKEKNYSIFKISYLINFWVYALCVIFLYNVLEPFISWWLGKQYLLNNWVFILVLVNFYLDGLRTAIATFKNKAGLFSHDKFFPIIEGLINLITSLVLLRYLGLAGIFLGTTISTITTILWTQPVIVYKHLFQKPVFSYFVKYAFYTSLTILGCIITSYVCRLFTSEIGFVSLVERGIVSLILPNFLFIIIFYKSKEIQYIRNSIRANIIGRLGKVETSANIKM